MPSWLAAAALRPRRPIASVLSARGDLRRSTSLGADGKIHRADCTGLFVFTPDGHASVQVMYRTPAGGNAGSVDYAQGGYEAWSGRYDVDERAQTWTFHVEGALVRGLVGKDLTRLYEFSGNQLIVKPYSPEERWPVTWERH